MRTVAQPERVTQNRVIQLFRNELGYQYFGNWQDRPNNSNIEETLLTQHLTHQNYTPPQISQALYKLRTEANNPNRSLYDNNKEVYKLLRYGIQVKSSASENTDTVKLINWQNPQQNDFAIAQEVTIQGKNEKRPDIVLYVNGIAIAILELKNSRKDIGEGIRWHTQGSGKSITMVLLTQWILENNSNARVVIVTDRDELDKQIYDVFTDAGENIHRTRSGKDLMAVFEMTHILEPTHNHRFVDWMDRFLPNWKSCRDDLNRLLTNGR